MEVKGKKEFGKLNISETVVERIAQLVVDEVEGVYSMAPSPMKFRDLVFRSESRKPIRLSVSGGVAQLDIYVTLKSGYKIKTVAEKIQEYVKDAVQNMASIAVSKVNVYICGVQHEPGKTE